VRAVLLELAPVYGFFGDHVDYVCWGRQIVATGLLDVYKHPSPRCRANATIDGRPVTIESGTGERLNYPPLAAYVFALEGRLLERLEPNPSANTVTSRTVYA